MDYCKLSWMIWIFPFSAALSALAKPAFMEAWNPHSSHVSSHYVIYLMPVPSSYFSSVITSLWNPSLTFYVLFNYLMVLLHYGTYHRLNLTISLWTVSHLRAEIVFVHKYIPLAKQTIGT